MDVLQFTEGVSKTRPDFECAVSHGAFEDKIRWNTETNEAIPK